MRRRGVTLIELMISLAGTALLSATVLYAYTNAIKVAPAIRKSQETIDADQAFREKVADILGHVYVLNNGANVALAVGGQRTYFTTNPQANNTGLSGGSGAASSPGNSSGSSGTSRNAQLVFTALGEPTSQAALQDASNDFVQQNQTRGPQGGIIEFALELTPVGDAGGKKGIFIREQRPADTDPTSGGYEWLLLPDVDNLMFEFWDGTQWQPGWDTTTQTPIRLPAAVRITYSKSSDTPKVFVVRLPLSDATPANPVTNFGNGMAGGNQ
ncbi:MAG TPA: type II secretion system protein GspJ [Fimbriimonadaceae bacterium]|nr:type II secretion system protein GspJ [Fimbriimonadaceae bacterium]